MKDSAIWVTGSRGFIGRHLISELEGSGKETRCFSSLPSGTRYGQGIDWPCNKMDYFNPADIRRQTGLFGVPDIFIHMGWADMAKPESESHLNENVKAGKTLIEAMFRSGVRKFIFIGSMNEYGARIGPLSEEILPEGRLTNYAKGKIEVAKFGFQSAKAHKKIFIHVRPFYVFGSGQRQGSLINELYGSYRGSSEINLSPCEHYRDYIHVSEVVKGLRMLSGIEESVTVNLGSGSAVRVKDFVVLFWKVLGGDAAKLKFGARPMGKDEPEQPKSYADLARLKNLVNWVPSLSLEDGIRITIKGLENCTDRKEDLYAKR